MCDVLDLRAVVDVRYRGVWVGAVRCCGEQEVANWLVLDENAEEVVFIKLDSNLDDKVRGPSMTTCRFRGYFFKAFPGSRPIDGYHGSTLVVSFNWMCFHQYLLLNAPAICIYQTLHWVL